MSNIGGWENETIEDGRYRVVRKLAQGGYGDVYLAHDHKMSRDVVLKVPRLSWLEDADFAARYSREIQAMVNLSHLHTVRVYDIGDHRGRPFAVLEYLSGETLEDRLAAHKRQYRGAGLPTESLQQWLPQIADALDYIHSQGYIHRDVKPSNIMFDGHGNPYLTDFGIAKAVADGQSANESAAITSKGQALGTCEYMAPELCYGKNLDGRVDQYALAVTVFEMLCGECPIRGATPLATMVQHTTETPPPLTEKNASIGQQLSDTVARALVKAPAERFRTCGEFAAAVLESSSESSSTSSAPILAEPAEEKPWTKPIGHDAPPLPTKQLAAVSPNDTQPSVGTSRVASTRRVPASTPNRSRGWIAFSIAGGALLLAIMATALVLDFSKFGADAPVHQDVTAMTDAERQAEAEGADGPDPEPFIDDSEPEPEPVAPPPPISRLLDPDWIELRLAEGGVDALLADYENVTDPDEQTVRASLHLSQHALRENPSELRMQLQARLVNHKTSRIRQFQSLPTDDGVQLLSQWSSFAQPGGPLQRSFSPSSQEVYCVAIAPDGRTVVSGLGDNTLRVWDLRTGLELRTLSGHSHDVNCVAIAPDGRTVVSGSSDDTLKVWDLTTGQLRRTFDGHSHDVRCLAITPDSRTVVSGSYDKTLRVWDLETGRERQSYDRHATYVTGVAIAPDGKTVVSCSLSTLVSGSFTKPLQVWDLETGQEIRIISGQGQNVDCVAITPDGRTIVSGSFERIETWDIQTGQKLRDLRGHTDDVLCAAIAPDGRTLVTGSRDKTLRVWDLQSGQEKRTLHAHASLVTCVAIAPNNRTVISGSWDNTLRVWDIQSERQQRTFSSHDSQVECLAISPDGRRIVTGSRDKTLRVWDMETGKQQQTFVKHYDIVYCVAIAPDGRTVVSASDRTLRIWDLMTGQELRTFSGHTGTVICVAIAADGRTVVSGSSDKTLRVWDLETGQELRTFSGHTGTVICVAIAADGRTVVSGSSDKTLRVWDLQTGRVQQTLRGHSKNANGLAIAPDGRTLVSVSTDETMRVWDLETGRELRSFAEQSYYFSGLSITPDGRMVISGLDDGTLQIRDIASGKVLSSLHMDYVPQECAISADGKTLIVGDEAGRLSKFRIQ